MMDKELDVLLYMEAFGGKGLEQGIKTLDISNIRHPLEENRILSQAFVIWMMFGMKSKVIMLELLRLFI